ncbi:unnamed protein product [Oncorhynchus mykiss]|uniref:General transcription factor IIF subunit 2 n=1 Tax=Oncorhynchus mykiss TaxID=8022 RepID=A0A060XIW9_ONCMY|nr:unnamed protein product [Oncorhynchus mykiss]
MHIFIVLDQHTPGTVMCTSTMLPPCPCGFSVEYEKRKKAEGRMVRAYRQQVMDMLFSAFEEHQYYNIKDLVEVAKQPAFSTYLKEILREMGVYNAKGTHKSTWELKPEYHHYQGSGEMKRDEPRKEHPVWDINAPSILFFDWYPKSHDQSVCLLSTCW